MFWKNWQIILLWFGNKETIWQSCCKYCVRKDAEGTDVKMQNLVILTYNITKPNHEGQKQRVQKFQSKWGSKQEHSIHTDYTYSHGD